jgi:hypothetical protein
MPPTPIQISVGDEVQMRKAHPCGSDRWTVYRVGADIGLRCAGCGRLVLLERSKFNKVQEDVQ